MNVSSEITPYLVLGSAGVRTPRFLENNKITLVINAAHNFELTAKCSVNQIRIDSDDSPDYMLKKHFETVALHIHNEKEKGGKVFIHCVAGISRAPSLVLAYLMRYENMSLADAYKLVHNKRIFVRPNMGFWKQLIEYEEELIGRNTVTMILSGSMLIPSIYETQYQNMMAI